MAEDLIQIAGYEMHREIGEGGMARVFLATQLSLGREVAIKVLRKELSDGNEDFRKRFLHEGQMLAKLVHPNIVAIYDIGSNDEVSYMAMEFLNGGTLTERMKQGLSVAEVIRITTQMAHALDLAHRNHIVHRDLKPSNIMFRDELTPVLTDFGIARKTDTEHRLTKTGMVVGTPYYMSPEQITGRDIDGRSDIYSLGIMFYELLAGELPFRAEEPLALAMQHVQESPPPLPEPVGELQPIMDRLLAKNADDRYQTMPEFVEDVKALVMDETAFREKLSAETKIFDSDQFSDPRFTGGSGMRTAPGRGTGSRRKAPAAGATAVYSGEAPARKAGWKLPAIAGVLVLALAVGAYLTFFTGPELEISEQDQRLISGLLLRANNFVGANQIGDATSTLEEIFAIAPDHPEARKLAEVVAGYYETDALAALRTSDLEAASAAIEEGLAISPAYEPLTELKAEVDGQLAEIARRQRIDELLARAEAAEEAGRLYPPEEDNAYAAYQEVLELDAANQVAGSGLGRLQRGLVEEARAALAAEDLDTAAAVAGRAGELFGNSGPVAAILQDVNELRRNQQEASRVRELLATAERQLAAEQYVFPPGDNALESFQAVLSLRPEQREASEGLSRIADHFVAQARAAFEAGDFGASADLASRGLRALPDDQRLLAIQGDATGRLDARARQIEQELQNAERLASEGNFLSGPGGGARAAYERVLETSPGNQRALAALDRLPDQIYNTATQLQRDGNFLAASSLLEEAAAAYPERADFASLRSSVDEELAQQQRRLRLEQMLAQSARLVSVRPITRSSFDQAALALKEILGDYPNDVTVRAQLGQLTSGLAEEADRLSAQGNHPAALRLLEHGLGQFAGSEALLTARSTIEDRQAAQLAAEAERIRAMTGRLAIDARPWGEVLEIRDAAGNPADLPPDATTPLVVSLLEGSYSVVVRGGAADESRELTVDVQRQSLVQARAEFPGMNAETYFETSGW